MKESFDDVAAGLVRASGERLTMPRVHVLAVLLGANRALTHQEVQSRLGPALAINRVTVYRVLDWLTKNRLAHRIHGDDRVWRFNAVQDTHQGNHAHFKCECCGRVVCLDQSGQGDTVRLPAGFRSACVELTIRGLCDQCPPGAHRHRDQPLSLQRRVRPRSLRA